MSFIPANFFTSIVGVHVTGWKRRRRRQTVVSQCSCVSSLFSVFVFWAFNLCHAKRTSPNSYPRGACLAWVNVVHPRDTCIISSSALLAILNTNPLAKLQALFKKAPQIPYFICRSVSFMPREIILLLMLYEHDNATIFKTAFWWCHLLVWLLSTSFKQLFFFSIWYCTSADVIRNQLITIDSSD